MPLQHEKGSATRREGGNSKRTKWDYQVPSSMKLFLSYHHYIESRSSAHLCENAKLTKQRCFPADRTREETGLVMPIAAEERFQFSFYFTRMMKRFDWITVFVQKPHDAKLTFIPNIFKALKLHRKSF